MGTLWDRSLDDGKGEVEMREIPLDGSSMHVGQFNREANTRNSWNTNGDIDGHEAGSLHFTNQNVERGEPGRH